MQFDLKVGRSDIPWCYLSLLGDRQSGWLSAWAQVALAWCKLARASNYSETQKA